MQFSQRMRITPVADVIQVDSMNDVLRAGLWNVLLAERFDRTGFVYSDRHRYSAGIDPFSAALWANYFKLPVDERPPENRKKLSHIRDYFFACSWYEVYDFIEFCVEYFGNDYGKDFIAPLNHILERELSGLRIIDGKLAPISSTEEVSSIQEAIADEIFPGASAHLRTALDLLSRKTNPDYRNSIKESISAVESACCAITGSTKATLGGALKELERKHALHGALKDGFVKLYGYTSDGDGIRHKMLEDRSTLTQADAVYFLVSCSAFTNYLKIISAA